MLAAAAKPRRQLQALRHLGDTAAESSKPEQATILPHLDRGQARKLLRPGPMTSKGLKRFQLRTLAIRKNNLEVNKRRVDNPQGNPFGSPTLARGSVFTRRPRVFIPITEQLLQRKRWKIVDACATSIPSSSAVLGDDRDLRVRRLDESGFFAFSLQAHLVVLDSVHVLASEHAGEPGSQLLVRLCHCMSI